MVSGRQWYEYGLLLWLLDAACVLTMLNQHLDRDQGRQCTARSGPKGGIQVWGSPSKAPVGRPVRSAAPARRGGGLEAIPSTKPPTTPTSTLFCAVCLPSIVQVRYWGGANGRHEKERGRLGG